MRIELANVDYRYEKNTALHGINAVFPSHSMTLLLGKTGSGKSTLLQLLSGLEKPFSGSLNYSEDDPRRKTAIVFQLPDTQIFANTIREDIEYGLELQGVSKKHRRSKVEKALNKVGLDPSVFMDRSPFLLSGGEKRRVVIAGALALEPQVLILDEPTAGLDPPAMKDLLDVLMQLHQQGLTIIISTHDLDAFLPIADRAIVMKEGGIHFEGGVRELVSNPLILEEAGLEVPAMVRFAFRLKGQGIGIDNPLNMEEILDAIRTRRLVFTPRRRVASEYAVSEQELPVEEEPVAGVTNETVWNALRTKGTYVHRLDPRSKWLTMILLSLVMLNLSSIWGVLASAIIVTGLLLISDIPWRKTYRFLYPFLLIFFFLFLFAAITFENADYQLGPVGISYSGAVKGGLGVAGFLLVLSLCLVFTETTNGSPLREGFEWALRPLRRFKVPTRDISMAVSITIQFVPWILAKFGQVRKALASRGQDTIGLRKWTPRQISFLIIPLVIIVLRMGDELVSAIESRGYNRQAERTSWYELIWKPQDTIVVLAAITITVLLWQLS